MIQAPQIYLGLCALALPIALPAQRLEPRTPVQVRGGILEAPEENRDPGVPVQMHESPNIDLFLRRAQQFLEREEYPGAIEILQAVIEGRTQEIQGSAEVEPAPTEEDSAANARNAVFSEDGRLYRPVRSLCHELIASLGPAGVALYRSRFEVPAERELDELGAAPTSWQLEQLYDRFFGTLSAGRALRRAGDLHLDQGSFRSAIQAYRYLLEVYPETARREAGIDDRYIRLRLAIALLRIGDRAAAQVELSRIASDAARDASLQLEGEAVPLADLADHPGLVTTARTRINPSRSTPLTPFRDGREELIALWEHRFSEPKPYRAHRAARNSRSFVVRQLGGGGSGVSASPRVRDFVPGNSAVFQGERVLFLDHQRLRAYGALDGRLLAESAGSLEMPPLRQGMPRNRVPAYDYGTMRPSWDGADRVFVLLADNTRRSEEMMRPLTRNSVQAMVRADHSPLWSTADRKEFEDVTFLAAPICQGERLYLPYAQNRSFGLLCLDATDGSEVYRVPIQREGTQFTKPPSAQAVFAGSRVLVATQAGTVAAVEAVTGSLRWIRRYERHHPLRSPPRVRVRGRQRRNSFASQIFQELTIDGFAPGPILVHEDLLVLAPCDGQALMCLDTGTGEPLWFASARDMQYLIGHDGQDLFVGGEDSVWCIGLRSGLRKWKDQLPSFTGSSRWRGRGTLLGNYLLLPGNGELLLRGKQENGELRRLPLEPFRFGQGKVPLNLSGPFNIDAQGAVLCLSYQGGMEAYSTRTALNALARDSTDPHQRAATLALAGDLKGALEVLTNVDPDGLGNTARDRLVREALQLAKEFAIAAADRDDLDGATVGFERCRPLIANAEDQRRWHLTRMEVFEAIGDADRYRAEQQALYRAMGGEGR